MSINIAIFSPDYWETGCPKNFELLQINKQGEDR